MDNNNQCCWNKRQGMETHNNDCVTFGPKWGEGTLVVTFTDGAVERYKDVRFSINALAKNPIVVDGSTVTMETLENTHTLCNVREFHFDF